MSAPRVAVFGAVSELGQKKAGVSLAPGTLRRAGLTERLISRGAWVRDAGDFEAAQYGAPSLADWAEHSGVIAQQTQAAAEEGELSLTLGGDHSVALGSIAGLLNAHPDLSVVWVDAHGDLNLPDTSPSGNFHGMPLAALLGLFGPTKHGNFGFLRNVLQSRRLALVGIRDLDPFEKALLKELPICAYTVDDVRSRGVSAVVNDAIARISADGSPLHLSFDVDALDPAYAPSTGCRVTNGLTLGEARAICRMMASTQRLVGMDLVEINPSLVPFRGAVERTIDTALELVEAAIPVAKSGLRTSVGAPELPVGALLH